MSGIAGILKLKGEPVAAAELCSMSAFLYRVGPDALDIVLDNSVAMAYCPFRTTAMPSFSAEVLASNQAIIAFDGRIDNRIELLGALPDATAISSDIELVYLSYLRWGADCFRQFRGDFAVAIWDKRSRQLYLARDPFGVKPLYTATTTCGFVWASTTDCLIASGVDATPDGLFIASYLWFQPDETRSPFGAIQPVPPGHVLQVREGRPILQQFWRISDCIKTLRHKNDYEYEEHFRTVLHDAIAVRLNSFGPVMSELSGGLDSSSITCLAHSILQASSRTNELATISFLYDDARWADERSYISDVEACISARHYHIRDDASRMLSRNADEAFIGLPSSLVYLPTKTVELFRCLDDIGGRVILSGDSGDAVFRNEDQYPVELAWQAWHQSPKDTLRMLVDWSISERKTLWNLSWNSLLKPIFFGLTDPQPPVPRLLRQDFVSDSGLLEFRRQLNYDLVKMKPIYTARHCCAILSARSMISTGFQGYYTSFRSAEVRYPYLDKLLVSFLLSIPPDQLWRSRQRRSIMRRALRGVLPESVRTRVGKAAANDAIMLAIRANWSWISGLLQGGLAVEAGYVDADELSIEGMKLQHGTSASLMYFLRILSVEVWLRNLCNGSPKANRFESRNLPRVRDLRSKAS